MLVQIANVDLFITYLEAVTAEVSGITTNEVIGESFVLKGKKRYTVKIKASDSEGNNLYSFTAERGLRSRKILPRSYREMYVNPKIFKQIVG